MVRVVTKELKDYFRKKGVVAAVEQTVATITMLDSQDVLQVDEADLDTVIPSRNEIVRIVRGQHAGKMATLLEKNPSTCLGVLQLQGNETVVELDYADFSKMDKA